MTHTLMSKHTPARLSWDCEITLFKEPLLLASIFKAFLAVYLIIALLMGVIFLGQGEWREWLDIMWVFSVLIVAMLVLSLLIMLIIFRNRMTASFILDKQHAFCRMSSRHVEKMLPYARWLEFFIDRPFGLRFYKLSEQQMAYDWPQITTASYQPQRSRIILRNGWRTLLILYCPPERYEDIVIFVERHIKAAQSIGQTQKTSVLPRILGRSTLTILACVSLFALPYPFEQDIFILIFLFCFSFATIWVLSLLGYAVLFGVFWSVGEIIYTGLHQRPATFMFQNQPTHYSGFDLLFGDEWGALALTLIGLSYLAQDAWRAVRGKNPSMLEQDYGVNEQD